MNAIYPFAVYAAVAAERGLPLVFNGTWDTWQDCQHHGTALLTGYLSEWAVLEDKCKNEAFNSQDTSPFSWDRFWEELVRWFNIGEGIVPPQEDEGNMIEIAVGGATATPMGYGPPVRTKLAFTMLSWAQDPENAKAWKAIMERHGLTHDPFQDVQGNFVFADVQFIKAGPVGMNKARRLGWTGFVDTMESIFEMYTKMNELGMLPPMEVDRPKALV